jgi:Zn-dependent peptidase ImmA (M78 family)
MSESSYHVAPPCNLSQDAIERLAELTASVWKYEATVDMTELVSRLSGQIKLVDTLEGVVGALSVKGRQDFVITLPNFSSEVRDRFTIAHELGHFVLHSKLGRIPMEVGRGGNDLGETEADVFAAAFLMNRNTFKKLSEDGYSEIQLAQHFNVSVDDVQLRLRLIRQTESE